MAGTLAIDLGSSTTVVAFQPAAGGAAQLLELPPYSCGTPSVIPSLLWLQQADSERPLVGRQVLEAGLVEQGGPQLQRDFKRWIGASPPRAGEALLSPEQAGTLLMERIWQQLPAHLAPSRLVLTAPIDSYRGYRRWLTEVTSGLAVPEVALVDEPTAAAIGAGLPAGSKVLVVDLGGGTIDLSLVALEGGEGKAAPIAQLLRFGGRDLDGSRQALRTARVLGKAGLALGGRDIDRWIAAALCPDLNATGQSHAAGLLAVCERLKCQLSEQPEACLLYISYAADELTRVGHRVSFSAVNSALVYHETSSRMACA